MTEYVSFETLVGELVARAVRDSGREHFAARAAAEVATNPDSAVVCLTVALERLAATHPDPAHRATALGACRTLLALVEASHRQLVEGLPGELRIPESEA